MEEIKKFYGFVELLFFLGGFGLFLAAVFLRNDYYPEIFKFFLTSFNLPFILIAITYGLLSFRFYLHEDYGESDVIDGSLLVVGMSIYIFIFFVFLTYPDKI